MSWIIIKRPHPLDRVWSRAIADVEAANSAMDALGDDFTDEQLDAAGAVRTEAIMTVMALPARSIDDSIYKLDLAGIDGGHLRTDCDPSAIMNEMLSVLDTAVGRGARYTLTKVTAEAHDAAA